MPSGNIYKNSFNENVFLYNRFLLGKSSNVYPITKHMEKSLANLPFSYANCWNGLYVVYYWIYFRLKHAKNVSFHLSIIYDFFINKKFRPERTGFNMYAEYTQLQLTFLA